MSLNAPSVARCTEMHVREVWQRLTELPQRIRRRFREPAIEREITQQEAVRMQRERREVRRRIRAIEAEVRSRGSR